MKVKVIQKSMICLFNGENSVFPPSLCRSFLLSGYTLFFPFLSLVRSSFPSSVSHSVSASAVPVTAPPSPCSVLPSPSPLIRSLFIYPSLPLLSRSFLLSTLPPFRRYSFIYSFNYESALFAHLGKSRTQRRER